MFSEIIDLLQARGYSMDRIKRILSELVNLIPSEWAEKEIFEDPEIRKDMEETGSTPIEAYLKKLKSE